MRCTKCDDVVEILLILNIATFVLFLPLEQKDNQNARGDGFAQETLPPFNLNGEKLLLYTKVSPSIIQAEDRQNRYLDIMVTDYDTEELVQNASYKIILYKDNRIIMEGKFHSESGPLKITIEPMDYNLKERNLLLFQTALGLRRQGILQFKDQYSLVRDYITFQLPY